jgi:hypothetical protein
MKITSSFFKYWTTRTRVFPEEKSDEKIIRLLYKLKIHCLNHKRQPVGHLEAVVSSLAISF